MPSDYPAIEHLWKLTGLATMFDSRALHMAVMRKTPELFLVAEINGKIVGAAVAFKRLKMGYVHHLAVHLKYQRQGIGSKLLDKRASEPYELIKFYNKQGFKPS